MSDQQLPPNFDLSQVQTSGTGQPAIPNIGPINLKPFATTPGTIGAPQQIRNNAALNSFLAGVPQAVMKKLGGTLIPKQYEQDPGVLASSLAGQVQGMAQPFTMGNAGTVGGLAGGALKGLGATKAGAALENLGTTGNLLGGVARGAFEGGVPAVARAAGSEDPNAGHDILTSALLGAATGGLASGVGGILQRGALGSGKLAQEARTINAEIINGALGANARDIKSVGSFGLQKNWLWGKADAYEALQNKLADTVTKERLFTKEARAAWNQQNVEAPYQTMDKAWEDANLSALDVMDPLVSLPSYQQLQQYPQVAKEFDDALLQATNPGSYRGAKNFLDGFITRAGTQYAQGFPEWGVAKGVAIDAKHLMDEQASQAAIKLGYMQPTDLDKFRDIYPIDKLMGTMDARHAAMTESVGAGSDTMAKMAITGALGGGIAGFNTGDNTGERLKNAGIDAVIGAVGGNVLTKLAARGANIGMARLGGLTRRLMGGTGATLPKAAQAAGAGIAQAAPMASKAAGIIPQIGPGQISPEAQQQNTPTPTYMNNLEQGIAFNYNRVFHNLGGAPDMSNPQYKQFHDEILKGLRTQNGGFDYATAGNVIFQKDADRKPYMEYHQAMQKIDNLLPSAAIGPLGGIQSGFGLQRGPMQSTHAITETIKDTLGPEAEQEANRIVRFSPNPTAARQQLQSLYLKYTPRLQDVLTRAGELQ